MFTKVTVWCCDIVRVCITFYDIPDNHHNSVRKRAHVCFLCDVIHRKASFFIDEMERNECRNFNYVGAESQMTTHMYDKHAQCHWYSLDFIITLGTIV